MQLVESLDWDSQFFGINIGRTRIDISQLQPKTLEKAIDEARARYIKCLYIEIPFGFPDVLAYCSENKFFLVDLKTTLGKKIDIKKTISGSKNIKYKLDNKYYPFLIEMAKQLSIQSRFSYDLNFGKEKSFLLYEEWLRKSFYEKYCDELFIYVIDDKPVGLVTIKIRDGQPYIDLLSVSKEQMNKGIGKRLINDAERKLLKLGYKELKVITQGHNISALRTYQSMNFKIESMNIYYHKWID